MITLPELLNIVDTGDSASFPVRSFAGHLGLCVRAVRFEFRHELTENGPKKQLQSHSTIGGLIGEWNKSPQPMDELVLFLRYLFLCVGHKKSSPKMFLVESANFFHQRRKQKVQISLDVWSAWSSFCSVSLS